MKFDKMYKLIVLENAAEDEAEFSELEAPSDLPSPDDFESPSESDESFNGGTFDAEEYEGLSTNNKMIVDTLELDDVGQLDAINTVKPKALRAVLSMVKSGGMDPESARDLLLDLAMEFPAEDVSVDDDDTYVKDLDSTDRYLPDDIE